MNQVDTTPETVEKEYQKIADEFGVMLGGEENTEGMAGEEGAAGEFTGEIILSSEERAEKERITSNLIKGSLGMVLGALQITDLPESVTDDFCNSWAVVIVKRFPENPITDFMEEYGDLVAAGGATLILIGAIRNKRREQVQSALKKGMEDKVKEHESEAGNE